MLLRVNAEETRKRLKMELEAQFLNDNFNMSKEKEDAFTADAESCKELRDCCERITSAWTNEMRLKR